MPMASHGSGLLSRLLTERTFRPPDHVALTDMVVAPDIIELVPESVARENSVMPVHHDADTITFATPFVDDVMLQDKLRFILNTNVATFWRHKNEVEHAINRLYGQIEGESADSMLQEFTDTAIDFTETVGGEESPDSIGKLIDHNSPAMPDPSPQHSSTDPQSNHSRQASMMFFTIPDGQRYLAFHRSGKVEMLKGPQRVFRWFKTFKKAKHHVAHPTEYLSVQHRDGRAETICGPCELWQDPVLHESIEVKPCLDLAAKEAVVVYRKNSSEDQSTNSRRVVHGPGLFAPEPDEWLHRFSWHTNREAEKLPGGWHFQKLCMMPDQMYHDVKDVRTSDDAVITIRLMIFFELMDIDRMLDSTHDPIGDFINATTSDVIEFTGKFTFEQFKQHTDQLNQLETYEKLLHRAEQCGYKINNVVYRGYGAPDSLQRMHDEAIQSRTRLQLERATEEQAQELEDYRLRCQVQRASERREEQTAEVDHDLDLKRRQSESELKNREREEAFRREQHRIQKELDLQICKAESEQREQHLSALQEMQVNLTEYLTQGRADRVIEVRGKNQAATELHFDQSM